MLARIEKVDRGLKVLGPHRNDPVRVCERQRLDEDAVNNGKDRRVGAGRECQREDGGGGEGWRTQQRAQRKADVGEHEASRRLEGTHTLLARILARYPGRDLLASDVTQRETIDRKLLSEVRVPVLVVNGARDTEARRRAGAALRDALPAAEQVLIPNAAHLPNLDSPREYNQLMSGFARRHLPAAA